MTFTSCLCCLNVSAIKKFEKKYVHLSQDLAKFFFNSEELSTNSSDCLLIWDEINVTKL